jgi:hypothetical protein
MTDDMSAAERKRIEAAMRRAAAAMGLVLRKSRARDECRMDYGCFRIESKNGVPIAGTYPYPYSLTLEGAAEALEQLAETPLELGRDAQGNVIHGRAGAADPEWGR